jgi:hypothetical protein
VNINDYCQIVSYNISLTQLSGAILNSIPDCVKTNSNASRLLTTCHTRTSTGQCFYFSKTDNRRSCVKLSNQDPNSALVDSLVQLWIICMINNIEVIEYGHYACT